MLKKTKKGFYILEKFSQLPGIIHGFSTRECGNVKIRCIEEREKVLENRKRLAQSLGFNAKKIVEAEQIHGTKIALVGKNDWGRQIKGVDGLLTGEEEVFLLIKTADCVPVLFFDSCQKVVGIAHAGWKGILGGIILETIKLMQTQFGSKAKNILVGLGPAIGVCCYDVPKERALKFQRFGKEIVREKEGKWYLDLRGAIAKSLNQLGVPFSNIEISSACTSCQNEVFFSFRKEGRNLEGEIGSVIGRKDY